eukprot:2347618-Prymnesium_polylepis.1
MIGEFAGKLISQNITIKISFSLAYVRRVPFGHRARIEERNTIAALRLLCMLKSGACPVQRCRDREKIAPAYMRPRRPTFRAVRYRDRAERSVCAWSALSAVCSSTADLCGS